MRNYLVFNSMRDLVGTVSTRYCPLTAAIKGFGIDSVDMVCSRDYGTVNYCIRQGRIAGQMLKVAVDHGFPVPWVPTEIHAKVLAIQQPPARQFATNILG